MSKRILLADDSITIRKVVELTFHDTDVRVDAVGSGEEALRALREAPPDLVLADVVMPAPTGYEICRLVKSSERPVPVILLAGAFEPFDERRARDVGADGQIRKPFESKALVEKVQLLLDRPPKPAGARAPAPSLTQADVEAIAEAVVGRLSLDVVREIAARVVPAVAERVIRERIRELEREERG